MNKENCPKCGEERTAGALECQKCAVIYTKAEKAATLKFAQKNEKEPVKFSYRNAGIAAAGIFFLIIGFATYSSNQRYSSTYTPHTRTPWPPKENQSAANKAVAYIDSVLLAERDTSPTGIQIRDAGQRWVMENIHSGVFWNKYAWEDKFGEIQQIEYQGSFNPNITKMYYVKSIDMTLMVNDMKKEIDTWRMGIAHK